MSAAIAAKAVVVGAAGVGKTSLIECLVHGGPAARPAPTVGSGFYKYPFAADAGPLVFEIWDTAGQERFRSLTRAFFKSCRVALFVFDLTSAASLRDLAFYAGALRDVCRPEAVVVALIGNKCDLPAARRIAAPAIADALASLEAGFFLEASALTGQGVDQIFPAVVGHPSFDAAPQEAPPLVERPPGERQGCAC
jgi:Ras-related protein Rab-11A